MGKTTQMILIVGGLAIAGYIVYKKFGAAPAGGTRVSSPVTTSTSGTGNSVTATTQQGANGDASFFNSLGSVGQGLNQGVSTVESTYNNIYDLFGGQPTSTNTGQGNNSTAG